MEIFGEKVQCIVPFPRNSTIDEISEKVKHTFCSIRNFLKKNVDCVVSTDCDRYQHYKNYLCNQHFFSTDAKEWMNNNTLDGKKYVINFNKGEYDITIDVNLFGEIDIDHLKLLFCKMLTMIVVNKIKNCQLEVNLVLLPIKRVYPDKFSLNTNLTLGVNEANGGFTTWRGNEWGKIYVWRKEELDKVLMHEMIHALHLDFKDYNLLIDQFFYDNFYIEKDGSFLFFEAYTEIWAEFLNIVFNYSYEVSLHGEDNVSRGLLYDKLCSELNFSLIQVSKILLWYGFETFTNCGFHCEDKCTDKDTDARMKEGTSIFSYYIVRSIYFYCLSDFLYLCVKERQSGKSAMNDGNSEKRHIGYLNILKRNIGQYGSDIDRIMAKLKKEKIMISRKILDTMRMTCECSRHDCF